MSELREHELQLDRAPSRVKRVYVALGCFGVLEFWGFGVLWFCGQKKRCYSKSVYCIDEYWL